MTCLAWLICHNKNGQMDINAKNAEYSANHIHEWTNIEYRTLNFECLFLTSKFDIR